MRARLYLVALVIAALGLSSLLAYCAGEKAGKQNAQLEADTRAADSAHKARKPVADAAARSVERVERAAPMVRASHDAARVLGPVTMEIRVTPSSAPQIVTVPAPVVARILEDSLQLGRQRVAIDSLLQLRVLDSLEHAADAKVIADLRAMKTPRCGPKCGAAVAVGTIVAVGAIVKNAGAILSAVTRRQAAGVRLGSCRPLSGRPCRN